MNNYWKIASCATLKLSNLTNNHQTMTIMNPIQNDENEIFSKFKTYQSYKMVCIITFERNNVTILLINSLTI